MKMSGALLLAMKAARYLASYPWYGMVTTSTSYPVFLANSLPLSAYHLLKSGFCSQWVQRTSFFCCAKLALGIATATITAARITSIHHPLRFMSSSLIPANFAGSF